MEIDANIIIDNLTLKIASQIKQITILESQILLLQEELNKKEQETIVTKVL